MRPTMYSSRIKTLAFAIFLTAQGAAVRPVGSIQAIQGNTITLKPDTGAEVAVTIPDTTTIVRVAPGQTDLKGATPLHRQDLQLGDRILVRGTAASDGHSVTASAIIVMKQQDVEAKQQADREDWQKRGVGGLVRSIDPVGGTITLTTSPRPNGGNTILVHTSAGTLLRRYAPDSAKFDNAKQVKLVDIKPGDQVRARGTRSPDGAEITAEEVVAGAFRNIAGTIASVDAAGGTKVITLSPWSIGMPTVAGEN